MVAKAGQHFIHAVGRRGQADLIEKDAGEIIPREELAKSPNRLLPDSRIVGTNKAEGLLHSAPFLGPTSPAAAAYAPPIHDEVGILHAFEVGKRAVPKHSVADRPSGAAELAEDFRRFSKTDDE